MKPIRTASFAAAIIAFVHLNQMTLSDPTPANNTIHQTSTQPHPSPEQPSDIDDATSYAASGNVGEAETEADRDQKSRPTTTYHEGMDKIPLSSLVGSATASSPADTSPSFSLISTTTADSSSSSSSSTYFPFSFLSSSASSSLLLPSSTPTVSSAASSTLPSSSAPTDPPFEGPRRFCSHSTVFTLKTDCKPCAMSAAGGCGGFGLRQLTVGSGVADCTYPYVVNLSPSSQDGYAAPTYLPGCRHTCERSAEISVCCPGYWGSDCNDCPGGAERPCGGHGTCFDGLRGNGSCLCDPGFTGTSCELCKENFYGSSCENTCRCEHGVCDDGVTGSGVCDCESGYKGQFCNEVIPSCRTLQCPNNSRCSMENRGNLSDTEPICICNHGYELDTENLCQSINRCEKNPSPCDVNAFCFPAGPATYTCSCMPGYSGDGVVCDPVDPCQTNAGGCPPESSRCVYTGPGQSSCLCLEGYQNYSTDEGCQLIDICLVNKTVCHEHANCTTTGPLEVDCVCEIGYVGNGQDCYGNILEVVRSLHANDAQLKGSFRFSLELMSRAYSDMFTKHGSFTLFLTTDAGYFKTMFTAEQLKSVFADVSASRQLIRQHVIAAQLTLEDLTRNISTFYTLESTAAELFYKNKDLRIRMQDSNRRATVVRGNVIAANGVIHVIDQVLYKPSSIVGSKKANIVIFATAGELEKSLGTMLSSIAQYSTLVTLLKAADLFESLTGWGTGSSTLFTLFAVNNDAFKSLPQGTTDYLLSPEGKGKLLAVLKNHMLSGPNLLITDLVNTRQFISLAGYATDILVTPSGRIRLNGVINITQPDIPASNGYIHDIDGLLLPDAILPLLPHRCDSVEYRSNWGTCGICQDDMKCPLITDIPLNETNTGCRYWVNVGNGLRGLSYVAFLGCQRLCNRSYTVVRCCPGFYGASCAPCPGGFQNQCLGRGKCADGFYGDGACLCSAQYTGAECEFCSDTKMFGPYCNTSCSCLHGVCDNRVFGSLGRCRPSSCVPGFTGANCDVQQQLCDKRLRINCHAFARCVRYSTTENILSKATDLRQLGKRASEPRRRQSVGLVRMGCECRQGYTGSGTYCVELDPCSQPDRGGCHAQADCAKTGPGLNVCTCRKGFVGDGTYCYPSSPCHNDSHCDVNAVCLPSTVDQYECACAQNYHGNGTYCIPTNRCITEYNGGCHQNATCVATQPGEVNCTCKDGLRGDGFLCYGSIRYEIQKSEILQRFNQLLQDVTFDDNVALENLTINYTVFAPSDEALEVFINSSAESLFWQDQHNVQALLGYHTLPMAITMSDLRDSCLTGTRTLLTLSEDSKFTLNCSVENETIYLNDVRVSAINDQPAINGYIHIVHKVLEPWSLVDRNRSLKEVLGSYPELSDFAASFSAFGLFDELDNMTDFTLFAPMNSYWNNEAESVSKRSRRQLSYYVARRGLSELRLRAMSGQHITTLTGNAIQQQLYITTNDNNEVFVNSIPINFPYNIRTAHGVIHAIRGTLKPELNICSHFTSDGQLVKECCANYYGSDCDECPGGEDNPCQMHGACEDGVEGNGTCTCERGYTGQDCSICSNSTCLQDACLVDNGGCYPESNCTVLENRDIDCSCFLSNLTEEEICWTKAKALERSSEKTVTPTPTKGSKLPLTFGVSLVIAVLVTLLVLVLFTKREAWIPHVAKCLYGPSSSTFRRFRSESSDLDQDKARDSIQFNSITDSLPDIDLHSHRSSDVNISSSDHGDNQTLV